MNDILEPIYKAGFSAYLHGFSAIDSWLGWTNNPGAGVQIFTNADTADLARFYEDLRFPGLTLADAAVDVDPKGTAGRTNSTGTTSFTLYFRCADSIKINRNKEISLNEKQIAFNNSHTSFRILEFFQDCKTGTFYDPGGIYPLFVRIRKGLASESAELAAAAPDVLPEEILCELSPAADHNRALMDAALIMAKYFPQTDDNEKLIKKVLGIVNNLGRNTSPGQEEQRVLLCGLMNSVNPAAGLELLKASGFITDYWKELEILDEADHSKDFHPEGNAWKHTMETFRYRKSALKSVLKSTADLRLSLGLLLHDTGKPISMSAGSKRFDGHAELGEIQARRFLERLGFETPLIKDVCFLVRNHMITAALPRLPLFRTKEVMASELFPLLLELYRCDESSSFKGLDGYYESSAAYQAFLRNRRNPYREPDGKKLKRKK